MRGDAAAWRAAGRNADRGVRAQVPTEHPPQHAQPCGVPQTELNRDRVALLFVEEPQFHAGDPGAIARAPVRNVTVLTPRTPLNAPGFHDDQIPLLSKLVGNALVREQMHDYGAWLDTPMALPLLKKLRPRCIVYDCRNDRLLCYDHVRTFSL